MVGYAACSRCSHNSGGLAPHQRLSERLWHSIAAAENQLIFRELYLISVPVAGVAKSASH